MSENQFDHYDDFVTSEIIDSSGRVIKEEKPADPKSIYITEDTLDALDTPTRVPWIIHLRQVKIRRIINRDAKMLHRRLSILESVIVNRFIAAEDINAFKNVLNEMFEDIENEYEEDIERINHIIRETNAFTNTDPVGVNKYTFNITSEFFSRWLNIVQNIDKYLTIVEQLRLQHILAMDSKQIQTTGWIDNLNRLKRRMLDFYNQTISEYNKERAAQGQSIIKYNDFVNTPDKRSEKEAKSMNKQARKKNSLKKAGQLASEDKNKNTSKKEENTNPISA